MKVGLGCKLRRGWDGMENKMQSLAHEHFSGGVASSSSTTLHCPVKPTTPATPILIPDSCPPVDGNPGNVVDLTTTSAEAQLDVTHPPLQTVSVTTSTSEVSASSSPGKKKEEDGKSAGMAATPLASGPLCGGSRVGVVEGVVNNEKKKLGDDDDDFKVSKKRLRKVPASDRPVSYCLQPFRTATGCSN